jgi:23S rRNA (uridine2552-2'-O)-methyltransferase
MSKRWHQEHRRDPWRRRAKREGYRARSAYKLLQIQEKFEMIREGDSVLDLGCHPGGWTQVAVGLVGEEGTVVGVDLLPTVPIEHATLLTGDIEHQSVHDAIINEIEGNKFNSVVSDISPSLTGQYDRDQAISLTLVCMVFDFGIANLTPGGSLVTKLFQGHGTDAIVKAAKERFSIVNRFSPLASRNASSEVYLVCRNLLPKRKRPKAKVAPTVEARLVRDGLIAGDVVDDIEPIIGFTRRSKSE